MPITGYFGKGGTMYNTADTGLASPTYGNALDQLKALMEGERNYYNSLYQGGMPTQEAPLGRAKGPKRSSHEKIMDRLEEDAMRQEMARVGRAEKRGVLEQLRTKRKAVMPRTTTQYLPTGGHGFRPVEVLTNLGRVERDTGLAPQQTFQMGGPTPEEQLRTSRRQSEMEAELQSRMQDEDLLRRSRAQALMQGRPIF